MRKHQTLWWGLVLFALFALAACDEGSSGLNTDGDGGLTDGDCAGGSCPGDPCINNDDCPTGYYCKDKRCVESDIVTDGDLEPEDTDGDLPADGDDGEISPDGDANQGEYDIEFETDVPHSDQNPWIKVAPTTLDFGAVPLNGSRNKIVTVMNQGQASLLVTDVYIYFDRNANPHEFRLNSLNLPIILAYKEQATISLDYLPKDLTPNSDLLVVHSNDPSTPNVGVEIITDVKAFSTLDVQPPEIKFGKVRLGHHTLPLVISNFGGVPVALYRIQLDTPTAEIGVEGIPADLSPTNPYFMDASDQLSLTVTYDPVESDGSEDKATLKILSNDELAPEVTVNISGAGCEPEIDVTPTILDFSAVDLGEDATRCVTINNTGCADLTLGSLVITENAGGAYTFNPEVTPSAIAPGESQEVCVRFAPTDVSQKGGAMEINSDDADEPKITVQFSSEVVPPDIDCTPNPLDFGDVPKNTDKTLTVTCRNVSTATLTVSDIVLDPATRVFTIVSGAPKALELNESIAIEIKFSPSDDTAKSAILRISSDDPDENPLEIPVNGKGYNPNTCPVAVASIASPPIADIEENKTVQLNGTGSYDNDAGDSIKEYLWTVLTRPSGSGSPVVNPGDAQPTLKIDKPGHWSIQLRVWDQQGMESCAPAVIEFDAKAQPPDIVCEPTSVDFGNVMAGQTATEYVTCRNAGYNILTISQYEIVTPSGGVFTMTNSPKTQLRRSEDTDIELLYTPSGANEDLGTLRVHSDDPDTPVVEIPLRGGKIPNTCPNASAQMVSPTPPIYVGDTVRFDGSASSDPDAGDSLTRYIWELQTKPAGSQTQIRPFNAPQVSLYVDQAGHYKVKFWVQDSYQLDSCNSVTFEFDATVPPPDLICTPMIVNFNVVPLGQSSIKSITCQNAGRGPLHISSTTLTPSTGPFSLISTPSVDLAPGAQTIFDVQYSPTTAVNHTGKIDIASNDPTENPLTINLMGNSYDPNTCPVPVINVTSPPNLNLLKPLDTVKFSGSSSYDPDAGDRVAEYIWTVVSRPAGSTAPLQNPSTATPSLFLDLAGTYYIKLEVRDTKGLISCTPAYVTLNAIPREIIHVQLVWDTDEGDMDLHLVKPGSSIWGDDCYFSVKTPNWGTYGKPSLDIDDQHGYGPENINLNDPGVGTYKVYVQYWDTWSESSNVNVTVRVYIYGQLAGTYQMLWKPSFEHYRWAVANIAWDGQNATVTPISTTLESDGHGSKLFTMKKKPQE